MGDGKRRRRARARWQGPARQVSRACAAGRKARSARLRSAVAEKPGSAGRFFALCVISGRSTRKGGLGGKIRVPCILNRPIAPGNGYIRRGSCHSDLEKHTFRANIARKRAYFAHSAKREYIWCDSCQLGTRAPQCEGGGCRAVPSICMPLAAAPQCEGGMQGLMGGTADDGVGEGAARRATVPCGARRDGLQCQGARHGRRDGREWWLIPDCTGMVCSPP